MASPYEGKVMRVEFTSGAEAIGTFVSAETATSMVTFSNVRFTKGDGGAPPMNPYEIKPHESFHSSNLHSLTVVDDAPAAPPVQAQPAPVQQYGGAWAGAPQNRAPPAQQQPYQGHLQQHQQPPQQQYQQQKPLQPIQPPPQNQQQVAPVADAPRQPAWGRGAAGRGGTGRAAQPPARAAQPAPTAGTASAAAGAPAAVPSSWARAVGGGAGGRGGGGRGGGGRGGRGRGRAWTPGVPQGDAGAAAVADDFDFAANNVSFEADKANFLAELGLDPSGPENNPVPPGQRKPEFDDDFFDTISHTLHEKTGLVAPVPRPGIKEQREINMETFGAVSVPRSAHPRGVGGRGYGGNNQNYNSSGGAAGGQGGGYGYGGGGGQGGYGRRGGGGGRGGAYRGGGGGRGEGGRESGGRWGRGGGRGEGRGEGRGRGEGGGGAWGRGAGAGGRGQSSMGRNGTAGGRGAMRGARTTAVV